MTAIEGDEAERLKRAKIKTVVFSLVCLALGLWMVNISDLYQVQFAVAIAGLLAGEILVRTSSGLIAWFATENAKLTAIAAAIPAVLAFAIQNSSVHILNPQALMWAAAAAGLLAATLWAAGSGRQNWRLLPLAALFFVLSAYVLLKLADVALAPPGDAFFPLRVKGKYESGSRSRSCNFRLGAWDDQPAGAIQVPCVYYPKLTTGDQVCIDRHSGALGLKWFEVKDCPPGIHSPPLTLGELPHDFTLEAKILAGTEGKAMVRCGIVSDARLADCHSISETPPGAGVGAAAVQRVLDPTTRINLATVKGHKTADLLVALVKTSALRIPAQPASTIGSYYPPRAQRLGKEGHALVQCNVGDDMTVTDCKAISEDPPGFGFGDAAVKMLSHRAKMDPAKLKASRIVTVPVAFRLAK